MSQDLVELIQSLKAQAKEPGDLRDTLERVALTAQKYFKADLCVIFPKNPITRMFLREKPTLIGKLTKTKLEDFLTPRETGLTNRVLSEKILLVEERAIQDFQSPITEIEQIRSFVAFALFTRRLQRPLAVMYLDYKKARSFDGKFQSDLVRFIELASAELQNTWFVRRYREITKIGQDINENLEDIEQMFDKVSEHMKGILDVSFYFSLASSDSNSGLVDLYLVDKGDKSVRKNYTLAENSITRWVIKNQKSLKEDDLANPKNLPEGIKSVHIDGTAPEEKSVLFVPLKIKNESLGALSIQHQEAGHYDEEDRQILELLANHMALALNNHRLLQSLKGRRLQELEDLQEIDREISQILDRDKILDTILKLTTHHIKADIGVILLYNKELNAIEAKAAIGENLPSLKDQIYFLDKFQGIAKNAFIRRGTIRIDNVRTDTEWKGVFSEISSKTTSEMDVPLMLGDEAIGVMNFESSREGAFSGDDQKFIETLAGQAVIAIKNAREYERARKVAQVRDALIDIVNILLQQTDEKEIFSIILQKALEITESTKGTISKSDEDRRELKFVVQVGLKEEWKDKPISFDMGVAGKVAREKRIIKIDQVSTDPLKDEFIDAFPGEEESELAVPILDGEKVMGVINIESEAPFHFEEDDVELVKSLATLCAVAIKNAENISQKQLASVGTITGNLSHKMNSPLDLIHKQTEFIELNCADDLARNKYLADKIRMINSVTTETIETVHKLIEEAKRSFGNLEKISLKTTLKKILAEVKIPATVRVEENLLGAEEPLEVIATPDLTNVFQNLIANAVYQMPGGGIIYINIERIEENSIIVSIEDTGKGIPDDIAALIFLPISEKETEGHGFGLPLIKAYIEWIGGKISTPVRGRNGKGAKFIIQLKKHIR